MSHQEGYAIVDVDEDVSDGKPSLPNKVPPIDMGMSDRIANLSIRYLTWLFSSFLRRVQQVGDIGGPGGQGLEFKS